MPSFVSIPTLADCKSLPFCPHLHGLDIEGQKICMKSAEQAESAWFEAYQPSSRLILQKATSVSHVQTMRLWCDWASYWCQAKFFSSIGCLQIETLGTHQLPDPKKAASRVNHRLWVPCATVLGKFCTVCCK